MLHSSCRIFQLSGEIDKKALKICSFNLLFISSAGIYSSLLVERHVTVKRIRQKVYSDLWFSASRAEKFSAYGWAAFVYLPCCGLHLWDLRWCYMTEVVPSPITWVDFGLGCGLLHFPFLPLCQHCRLCLQRNVLAGSLSLTGGHLWVFLFYCT